MKYITIIANSKFYQNNKIIEIEACNVSYNVLQKSTF
jgi:hypothetical protein